MTYNNKRYLKLGVAAGVTLVATYYFYSRDTIPSGSTTGGLIYGWLGFIGILVLMFLGIRKRWHASHLGTVQGWTSAHVYLGLLTILIIPMHAGFRFGLDVHTLAFVLLVVVVLSGIVGLWLYLVIPERLTQFERVMLPEKLEAEINLQIADGEPAHRGLADSRMQSVRADEQHGHHKARRHRTDGNEAADGFVTQRKKRDDRR